MLTIRLADVYARGSASFEALSPLERDVFAVHDANIRYEMEGNLESFASAVVATHLVRVLERAHDKPSLNLFCAIAAAYGSPASVTEELSANYYALLQPRWAAIDMYLESLGHKVVA